MIRLPVRLFLSLLVLLVMLVPFFVTARLGFSRANSTLVMVSFWLGQKIWGLKVKHEGRVSDKLPLLIVSNHFSYTDVFVLGGILKVRFTPKVEIASWPFIGFFCKITGCLFIDRRPHKAMQNKTMLDSVIHKGDMISLFAEGTTNDGTSLLPFKSSLLSIAENPEVTVQPVSIIYERINGEPLTYHNRHLVGWYADMEFFPHMVVLLQQKSIDVKVVFHKPVKGKDFASRKELASYCHDAIAKSLSLLSA